MQDYGDENIQHLKPGNLDRLSSGLSQHSIVPQGHVKRSSQRIKTVIITVANLKFPGHPIHMEGVGISNPKSMGHLTPFKNRVSMGSPIQRHRAQDLVELSSTSPTLRPPCNLPPSPHALEHLLRLPPHSRLFHPQAAEYQYWTVTEFWTSTEVHKCPLLHVCDTHHQQGRLRTGFFIYLHSELLLKDPAKWLPAFVMAIWKSCYLNTVSPAIYSKYIRCINW